MLCSVFFVWVILRMTPKMSSRMEFPLLVAILFCFFCWFSFWLFVLLFCSFLVCIVFDGIARWTLYWSTTISFEAADPIDGLTSKFQFSLSARLNVCNDLAKAMKALDGKNVCFAPSSHGREPELQWRMQMPFSCLAESTLFCANFAVVPAGLRSCSPGT